MRWFLALALLAAPLVPLPGQTPPDRLALDRFRDSLAAVHDTASIRTLHDALTRRRPADPLTELRAAHAALRLSELGADPDASDARGELRRLAKREPGWPLAWHALAVAEVRRAAAERANPLALGSRVGTGTLERALEDEQRALAADPAYLPAALTLAQLALDLRDTSRYEGARDALRRADAAHRDAPARLLLARGRLERATAEPDSAAATFARAAARDSASDSARDSASSVATLARLELARTLLGSGATGGEADYYDAAAHDDPAVVAACREDLVPIATTTDLAEFDAARGPARAAFLRRFWTDRDRAELRRDGERLREHYRRLLYARRHFALTVARRFYGDRDAWKSGSQELDDRGLIYVRHGEPETRLRPFVFGLMPNETWRYGRADGDLLLHFSAGYDESGGGDLYDYRLVESVMDLRGASDAPRDQLLLSRQTLSPVYGRMLNWGPYGAARARGHERAIGAASIEYGTTSDSYELQFARHLTVYADMVAVGTRDGRPLAHFVFAVGPEGTTPLGPRGLTYPVRVRLVALDGSDHALAHADTTIVFELDRPLERGRYLMGRVELPLPPGRWSWRAALAQGPNAGVVLPRDTVRVGARGPTLSLSDLALGVRTASAAWYPTPADTVRLTPFDLFVEGSEVELYYEGAGVEPGATYGHRIAVYRVRGPDRVDPRPVVALGFDERAGGDPIRSHRLLQLRRLKPGPYVVEVRLTGPDGQADVRRRAIRVVKPE